jgi:hypothetical protein
MAFCNERLHHTKKEVLSRTSKGWSKLSSEAVQYLEDAVDTCGGVLSHNKWKKLYALLAELGNNTATNYRIYLSSEGLMYDTTTHELVTPEDVASERTHQDIERTVVDAADVGQLRQLRRWKLEIDQLSIKIQQMTEKRGELQERYRKAKESFVEEL